MAGVQQVDCDVPECENDVALFDPRTKTSNFEIDAKIFLRLVVEVQYIALVYVFS